MIINTLLDDQIKISLKWGEINTKTFGFISPHFIALLKKIITFICKKENIFCRNY
jgi:hypothetical protein